MSSAAQALADVQALEDVIGQLRGVRGEVSGLDMGSLENAGGGKWAGQKRTKFTNGLDTAKASYAQIRTEIDQAISDCKSRQRSLALSINPTEHPVLWAQANVIAF